jgi:Flp pilus assembly protein TadB
MNPQFVDVPVFAPPVMLGEASGTGMLELVIFGLILAVLGAFIFAFVAKASAAKAESKTDRLKSELGMKEYIQSTLKTSEYREEANDRMGRIERDADRQRVTNKLNAPVVSTR